MLDDIVTRLREYEAIVDHPFVMSVLVESADEIKRLRAEIAQLKKEARGDA